MEFPSILDTLHGTSRTYNRQERRWHLAERGEKKYVNRQFLSRPLRISPYIVAFLFPLHDIVFRSPINYGYCFTTNELLHSFGISVTAKPVQYTVIIICIQSKLFIFAPLVGGRRGFAFIYRRCAVYKNVITS